MANEFVARNGVIAQNNSIVTGSLVVTNGITGSLFGTSSLATSASYALTASFVNTLNQNVVITGSLTVGTGSGNSATENTLTIGPAPAGGTGEGGQLLLMAKVSEGYASASMLDTYQNRFRVLKGTNTGSTGQVLSANLDTGQITITSYTTVGAFPGTVAANLAVDSGGNILTVAPGTVTSASYAYTASSAVSSSYALTASYALNGGGGGGVGFPFSGSAVITGSFLVSQSFVDFSKASYVTGSFTGSLFGTASYATFAVSTSFAPGFTVSMSQATPATTWSFTHNLNTRNPIIQVYDTTFAQIIPNQIVGISPLQAEIRFDYGQNGYAIASNGGGLYVTGSTALLNQTSPAVTWSFQHNLNNQYNTYQVYDTNNYVIIPSAIKVIDNNNTEIHLNYSSSGKAVASFSGINGSPNAASASYAITASFAVTASYVLGGGGSGIGFPFTGSAQITGSLGLSGSLSITSGSLSGSDARFSGFVTIQSASVDYAENTSVTLGAYRVIASEATSSYRAAFFDYVMFSGSVVRAGTVTSTWSGSSTEYYENYTADLGGSTSGVQLQTALSTGNIQLQASSSTSAWTIRSLIRLL